jgi:hypothetical protein
VRGGLAGPVMTLARRSTLCNADHSGICLVELQHCLQDSISFARLSFGKLQKVSIPQLSKIDSGMEALQIQQLTKKCAALFRARVGAHGVDDDELEEQQRQIVEDQSARFNLWADNNGRSA